MRLLLVEDDAGVRESMQDVLAEVADVHPAASVAEALAALEREAFGLLLTDLHLDTWDGARAIVAAARRAWVPVAVVSAASQAEVAALLAPDGPDARLAKPFDIDALLALAGRFVRLWAALDGHGERVELRPGVPLPVLAPGVVEVVGGSVRVEGRPFQRGYLTRRQLAALGVDAPSQLRYVAELR